MKRRRIWLTGLHCNLSILPGNWIDINQKCRGCNQGLIEINHIISKASAEPRFPLPGMDIMSKKMPFYVSAVFWQLPCFSYNLRNKNCLPFPSELLICNRNNVYCQRKGNQVILTISLSCLYFDSLPTVNDCGWRLWWQISWKDATHCFYLKEQFLKRKKNVCKSGEGARESKREEGGRGHVCAREGEWERKGAKESTYSIYFMPRKTNAYVHLLQVCKAHLVQIPLRFLISD